MKIYRSKRDIELFIVFMAIIVILLLIFTGAKNQLDLKILIPFTVLSSIFCIYVNRKSKLIIDQNGIIEIEVFKTFQYTWDEVKDFELTEYDGFKIIGFDLTHKKKLFRHPNIDKDHGIDDNYTIPIEEILNEIKKYKS